MPKAIRWSNLFLTSLLSVIINFVVFFAYAIHSSGIIAPFFIYPSIIYAILFIIVAIGASQTTWIDKITFGLLGLIITFVINIVIIGTLLLSFLR